MALASAFIMAACSIPVFTFGLFLEPLMIDFGWSRGPLSLAPSIAYVLAGFLGIVTGKLSDRYGPRVLVTIGGTMMGVGFLLMSRVSTLRDIYVYWGTFMGLAVGCFISPLFSTIPRWFLQKPGTAVSILATGFGVGALVSPLLVQMLISAYGWQKAFPILAVAAWAIVVPLAQLLKKSPAQMGERLCGASDNAGNQAIDASMEGLSLGEAVRMAPFWLYGVIGVLWSFCSQAIVVHIVPYATATGIVEVAAVGILSAIGGASLVSRASMGFVSDRLGARKALGACLMLAMLALGWLIFAQGVLGLYVFAIAFGLASGALMPLMTLVPAELFGTKSLGAIIGVLTVYFTVGGAGGAPFAGYVFDATGSYLPSLRGLAVISIVGTILGVVLLKYGGKDHSTRSFTY
ncbi:MAG: MFS transporter [Dehalococcoidia bacterium]